VAAGGGAEGELPEPVGAWGGRIVHLLEGRENRDERHRTARRSEDQPGTLRKLHGEERTSNITDLQTIQFKLGFSSKG
jgi:hypothetical protein